MFECFLLLRRADNVFLCSVNNRDTDFRATALKLASRISAQTLRMSHEIAGHQYHLVCDDDLEGGGLTFILVCDAMADRRSAFQYLDRAAATFSKMYPPTAEPIATFRSDTCVEFRRHVFETLAAEITSQGDAAKGPGAGARSIGGDLRLHHVNDSLGELKGIMSENMNAVLARGVHLDSIVDQTTDLEQTARGFHRSATSLRRAAWWQNMKLMGLLGGIGCLILLIILVAVCGPTLSSC